jgi:hypothetical protein
MDHDTTLLALALEDLCTFHLRRTEDLAAAEPAILDEVYAVLRNAMGDALTSMDDELYAERPVGWQIKDKRSRTLFCEFGEITYARRIYIDDYGDRSTLLDDVLDIAPRRYLSTNAFSVVCRYAADIPYGRAADLLCRHTDASLSAPTVMGCLREMGAVLREQDERRRRRLFDEGICPEADIHAEEASAESDGVWIHLQEQKAKSVEVKAFCAYSGKEDGRRKDIIHHAQVSDPETFSKTCVARFGHRFSLESLNTLYYGSDGGAWNKTLPESFKNIRVVASLDKWHINRMIEEAFPLRSSRMKIFALLAASDVCGLIEYLKVKSDRKTKVQDKVRRLYHYIKNNRELICVHGPSLGTMEGTIAHLYAARMKAWGGGWSRRGAGDMARIRAGIFSGEVLPKPHARTELTKQEIRRREKLREKRLLDVGYTVYFSEGEGYEMPQGHLAPFSDRQSLVKLPETWAY